MRITIDPDKCIASGACVIANPEVFAQDDDGIVVLLDQAPAAGLHAKVREASVACPAWVIDVQE
ncbi:ferredoxin [Rhodococcus koreensis]